MKQLFGVYSVGGDRRKDCLGKPKMSIYLVRQETERERETLVFSLKRKGGATVPSILLFDCSSLLNTVAVSERSLSLSSLAQNSLVTSCHRGST